MDDEEVLTARSLPAFQNKMLLSADETIAAWLSPQKT
jgi:hypothetical protein